jgi:twitching motility two-component system response regulator PilH
MPINKILIVDDTPSQLEAFKSAMPTTNARILTATSGAAALDVAKTELPDIIFMDIVMDDMDGYNTCREIANDPATKDIPVVFVSTKNQRADQMWAERQGGKALIAKPISTEQIEEQLKRFS